MLLSLKKSNNAYIVFTRERNVGKNGIGETEFDFYNKTLVKCVIFLIFQHILNAE